MICGSPSMLLNLPSPAWQCGSILPPAAFPVYQGTVIKITVIRTTENLLLPPVLLCLMNILSSPAIPSQRLLFVSAPLSANWHNSMESLIRTKFIQDRCFVSQAILPRVRQHTLYNQEIPCLRSPPDSAPLIRRWRNSIGFPIPTRFIQASS